MQTEGNALNDIEVAVEDEPKRKASLGDILELTRQADDAADGLEIDLEELGKDLRNKIDHIVEFIDDCEARAASLKRKAQKFEDKATVLENRVKRLKEYVAQQILFDADLRANETGIRDEKPRITGNDYEISVRYSEQVVPSFEPDAVSYRIYSNTFVRRKYEWDKRALRDALKTDNKVIAKCAALKKVAHIKITPKG